MNLIPIGMSVYTRIHHFKQSVEALQKNLLAVESEFYIYSDAASKKEDEALVREVRAFAHSITGFKRVYIIERERNYGGVKNSWLAWKEMSEKRKDGLSIYLEDDIVTAPGFLSFMNAALMFYQYDDSILSITGYCPPIHIPSDIESDVFALPRVIGWGMGSFPRTVQVASQRINKDEFGRFKSKNKKIFSIAGDDVLPMIELEANGELDAGDVRCMYYQALQHKHTIYPIVSLVQNIGHAGGGVHSGVTSKFQHQSLWTKVENFQFLANIQPDAGIMEENMKFRKPKLSARISAAVYGTPLHAVLKRIKRLLVS